ncbi:MAG: resA 8 [Armatimonadetes bacterium]|jgi:hypothetical protein|nr:resA 8 [Armatimonadota bacterium]
MFRMINKYLLLTLVTGSLVGSGWMVSRAYADKGVPIDGRINSLPVAAVEGTQLDLAAGQQWKVLYFWSDTCPCVKRCEQVNLVALSKQFQGRVSFFAVASNRSNISYRNIQRAGGDVELPLLRTAGGGGFWPPYPVVVDARHHVADALGATFTPEVFLLSPDNRLVFRGVPDDSKEFEERTGKQGLSKNYLRDALVEAMAGKKVSRPVVQPKGNCSIDRTDAAAS